MLEARSLTKYYGPLPALRDASFIAKPGQILGYLGPNGSGKSTTVRMLVGLMEPSNGDVLWKGKSIFDDLPAYRKQLGYVPEEPFLYTHLTAPEYLRLVGGLRGVDDAVLETKIERFLEAVRPRRRQYSTLSAFSKGMRQKVLLASALLHNPELIILDEPFSGLDVSAALMLRNVIKIARRRRPHHPDELARDRSRRADVHRRRDPVGRQGRRARSRRSPAPAAARRVARARVREARGHENTEDTAKAILETVKL